MIAILDASLFVCRQAHRSLKIVQTISPRSFIVSNGRVPFRGKTHRRSSSIDDYDMGGIENEERSIIETKGIRQSPKFVDYPFSYQQEITLTVDDVTNLGVGVGRVTLEGNSNNSTSWVVMVPLVLPGEKVKVKVFRNHATYSEADLVEIITASPDRVEPECPYFEICGGCQYQMMSVTAQRRWKRAQVESLMTRLGGVELSPSGLTVGETVGTEHVYGYRSKITPHYNAPKVAQDLKVGFQKRGTRIVIDVAQCVIATPGINVEFAKTRASLASQVAKKLPKKGATLLFREGEGGGIETDFRKNMVQRVKGVQFTFKAGEFFQNNAHVLPLMVDHVITLCTAHVEGKEGKLLHLIDAYCGSGLFSLCAAEEFVSVYGVEVSELAVQAAQANAKANNISNAQFLCGSSEAIFSKVKHLDREQTVMILDPPRKGCDKVFLDQLFAFSPKRVVYVSCDPATQARDAKILQDGGYRIKSITPFDLFPQTRHIECVVSFERVIT